VTDAAWERRHQQVTELARVKATRAVDRQARQAAYDAEQQAQQRARSA
jgi:hypothetical protein